VTVSYSGQIPEGALESARCGSKRTDHIKIERTMTLLPRFSRLQIDVKDHQYRKTVAPAFRNMPRIAFAGAPPIKNVGNCAVPARSGNTEFFTPGRGSADMTRQISARRAGRTSLSIVSLPVRPPTNPL